MKKVLLSLIGAIFATAALAQEIPSAQLTQLVASTMQKAETFLAKNNYTLVLSEMSNDTLYKTYEFNPAKNKKSHRDSSTRTVVLAGRNDQFDATYHTTSPAEYLRIIAALKKEGFYCNYEKDKTVQPASFVYQNRDRTAALCITQNEGHPCHSIRLHRQKMPASEELQAADDLFKFASHEYLVHYFGEKNVRKDLFYFAKNDVVNCSVLFMNTSRQVIFVWKDALNQSEVDNLIFGGLNKLKSQAAEATLPIQNQWKLKNGLRTGMHLIELYQLNKKGIVFCGGDAPNPGLILPESTGAIDFLNADVVLSCVNCTDEKFMGSQVMQSDMELNGGRIFFVQSIVLYPSRL